jgi:4a-hydroxytetrahydrobiopterin dehydratase
MSRERLDDAAISAALVSLTEWTRDGDELVRVFRRRDFRDAVALIDAIADAAEAAGHHPDLCLRAYRTLELRLTTHDRGGITARDVELATTIEELARG